MKDGVEVSIRLTLKTSSIEAIRRQQRSASAVLEQNRTRIRDTLIPEDQPAKLS